MDRAGLAVFTCNYIAQTCDIHSLLSCAGKNQESWALDLEVEDLKLLCPDGSEAGLDEYERCHLAAVPANAVVVRMEDKCRVWKYLERLQVGVDINCIRTCVCVCVISRLHVFVSVSHLCGVRVIDLSVSERRYLLNRHPSSLPSVWETAG